MTTFLHDEFYALERACLFRLAEYRNDMASHLDRLVSDDMRDAVPGFVALWETAQPVIDAAAMLELLIDVRRLAADASDASADSGTALLQGIVAVRDACVRDLVHDRYRMTSNQPVRNAIQQARIDARRRFVRTFTHSPRTVVALGME